MASYPNQDGRPLKRPRFGPIGPDVYPQESKQKEDELNHSNVKHGFQQPSFDDEYKSAKDKLHDGHDLTEEKINKFFNGIFSEKTKINTVADPGKRRFGQNIRDIFWPVTQGSKVEPWLKDLAGTKSLTTLSKKVPIFNKKEDIFKNLCDYNVPMKRAVWFIKMTNSYHAALAESRVRYRGKQTDPFIEWAQVTKDFLKSHLQKITDHYQGSSVQSLTVTSMIDMSMKYWTYGTQLAKHMYERGLLERHEFLSFFLDQVEKQKSTDDTVLKLVLGQILRYLSEYMQSQLLARKLAYFCCKKISSLCNDSGCTSPRTQSPSLTTGTNGAVTTGSGNISPQPQNPITTVFKEYNSCPQHRSLILTLSAIIQSVVFRCPGSLIWHNLGEGKMTSALSGSPLDLLPCAPSCLPMPPGMDNPHLREQLRRCEVQITLRSRMSESRWSSDKCQQSTKGFTISKILQVLDKLDRQNFARIEVSGFLDCLYNDVFGVLQSKENEPPISDEPIVNLLCEWAVNTQRTGEYRALIVAKLLEKRQNILNMEKYTDDEVADKGSDAGSDIIAVGGVPVFQGLLLSFLDNKAPYLEEPPSFENKQAFCNLIHLFSELIIHDVFSHDAYMCTLISRGDLADAPTLRLQSGGVGSGMEHMDISSVRSEITRHETPRMDLDHQHLGDQDIDIFAFKDEAKSSPGQPASVKSIGPFSVPTPGQAQTPIAQTPGGMARTPGGPTTPLGKGARTPGAPHTPGAHTPGKATTPLGAGGLTPGMAHTPSLTPGGPTTPSRTPVHGGPHTPSIVAYLSGSGGHYSGMSAHTPRLSQTPCQQAANQSLTEDTALRAKKHLCYAMHLPIPQDEYGNHECNQRMVMLYGFGKVRDEARHAVKKITKEIIKMFGKKSSLDVCSGEVKKKEKKKEKGEKDNESVANYEGTLTKFNKLSYYDQHALTQQCINQVLESIQSFSSGSSQHLPLIENITYLCDLMEMCYNINGLVEFLVELLKELPEVDNQLNKKKSSLEGSYCSSLCLCAVSVLRRYHAYLLVTNDLTCSVFESLCNIVKHVGNPADCTSAERCILAYLYDLFTTSYHVKTKFQELFSGASAKVKAALFATVAPSASNHAWDPSYMSDLIENPRLRIETSVVKQIIEPSNRYSFVYNIIHNVCNTNSVDRLNELTIMSAELTSMCNPLSCEWLGVLKALCCCTNSAPLSQGPKDWSKNCGSFMDGLFQIKVNDYNIHDSLAIFTALLVARHCFSIEDIIIHVALPSLLSHPSAPSDTEAEHGARLTCHLLLRLFQTAHIHPNMKAESRKHAMFVKSSTDRHLLDAAHEACNIDAIVAVLKALIMLSDSIGATVKKKDSEGDIIQTMLKSLGDEDDDDDLGLRLGIGMPGFNPRSKGVEHAGLSDYARHVLKEICSQDWVREKFLKDPETLLTTDLLLDNMLSHKQAQQLVHLICYPEGVPSLPPIDEDDDIIPEQKRNISRILHNMDQWKLRVSWLELQLMFKQTPPSEMTALLDNVSEATIEVFTNETMKKLHSDVVPQPQSLWSETEKESIWLIAPLISKLSSTVQGRVLKAAGEELKTGNNFWTAKNANEKERYLQKSISLMGHQPFLSLVLTCLKGQDEQREGLLKSLYEQLEKFVNNTKEPQDRGIPTDDRLKLMMQESLRLRMSLVGGMFDTIQRNTSLLTEWTLILIQLLSYGVVTLGNSAELFLVVLDMLSVLLHGTLVVDTVEGKDDRRTYSTLVRKLRKETESKKNDSMDLVKQLLPLPKPQVEVILNENHKVKKQQGFQVSSKQKPGPWDLIEGHKNPSPLSLSWFGAIRLDRKPLKYEEQHRLLLYHTHSMKKPTSHYLDPPVLPAEDLDPPPEQKEDLAKPDPKITSGSEGRGGKKPPGKRPKPRARTTTPNYPVPAAVSPGGGFVRPGLYDGGNWGGPYGPNNPGPQPGFISPRPLAPGGPGYQPGKAAIGHMIHGRYGNSRQPIPTHHGYPQTQVFNRRPIMKRNHMMTGISPMSEGPMYGSGGMQGFNHMNQGMGQNYGPGGYNQPGMAMDQGMGGGGPMAGQGYNSGFPGMQQGSQPGGFMGSQGQVNHPSRYGNMGMSSTGTMQTSNMSNIPGNTGGQMTGYSNIASSGANFGAMQPGMSQQRMQQLRQQMMMQQQQQQQSGGGGPGGAVGQMSGGQSSMQPPQPQNVLLSMQRQMSNPGAQPGQQPPPPQYGSYSQF